MRWRLLCVSVLLACSVMATSEERKRPKKKVRSSSQKPSLREAVEACDNKAVERLLTDGTERSHEIDKPGVRARP